MKTTRINNLKYAVAPMALGLAMISTPSFAQAADAASADAEGSIVVTGSRIARPDLESNSPISIITGQQLQDQGVVNVEQALNLLPQVQPDCHWPH